MLVNLLLNYYITYRLLRQHKNIPHCFMMFINKAINTILFYFAVHDIISAVYQLFYTKNTEVNILLTINTYLRAKSLDEAYKTLQNRGNIILGGMLWLKMQNKTVNTAIDLCDLGLDKIEVNGEKIRIGSMSTLRQLETSVFLNEITYGAVSECLKHIVGVQFRNLATVGGSVYGRFGFSDIITLLLALDAEVELYAGKTMPLSEFIETPAERDIIVSVSIPNRKRPVVYLSQRNSYSDFPVLTCALSTADGNFVCSVGARPMKAAAIKDNNILSGGITDKSAEEFAAYVSENMEFGSNQRASAGYRRKVCETLVKRAVLAIGKEC